MIEANNNIIALYCRSSIKNDKSIEEQQKLLTEYVDKSGTANYKFYIDNGFSCELAERPALKELLDNINNDIISAVVVVDNSRLSREQNQFNELKKIFDLHNVAYLQLQNSELMEWHKTRTEK